MDVLSHDYTLDERGRRTRAAREDGTHWDYGYNDRGEVTAAAHERADNAALPGRDFSYAFDAIGNRVTSSVAFSQPPPQTSAYTSNPLNQYTQISRSNPLRRIVQGLAHPEATVEVRLDGPAGQSRTVARVEPNGAGFMAEAEADTALAGVWRQVVVEASRPGVGVNGGPVTTKRTGWLFFPPQNETLVYDADGNLTEDARWLYTWDGENRLTVMEEKAIANASPGATPPARKRLEFGYDHQGRRVSKQVYEERESDGVLNWAEVGQKRFVYDGWNLIAEMDVNGNLEVRNLRSYAWGYDLSGTEQGAGGVGGLVLVKQPPATVNNSQLSSTSALAPCYDGNGNILAYMDCATGAVAQRMEYDAFGNELTLDSAFNGGGSSIREVPFRFSTKYTDAETNLSYYGYRYYSAEMGRWINRDPIEERGGVNLYGMVGNDFANNIDVLGQLTWMEAARAVSFSATVGRFLQEAQFLCSKPDSKIACSMCCFAIGQLRGALSALNAIIGVSVGGSAAAAGFSTGGPLVAVPGAVTAVIAAADGFLGAYDAYKDHQSCIKGICGCSIHSK